MQEHVLNMAIAIIMDCNLVPADMGQKSNYDLLLGGRPRPSRKRGERNQNTRQGHVMCAIVFFIQYSQRQGQRRTQRQRQSTERITGSLPVCYIFGILTTQAFQV